MSDEERQTEAIPFKRIRHDVFYRVVSPDSEYVSRFIVSIHDSDLPGLLRHEDESSALFLVKEVNYPVGQAARVLVEEIDDIDDSILLDPALPVPAVNNWAQVVTMRPGIKGPIRLARIDHKGKVQLRKKR